MQNPLPNAFSPKCTFVSAPMARCTWAIQLENTIPVPGRAGSFFLFFNSFQSFHVIPKISEVYQSSPKVSKVHKVSQAFQWFLQLSGPSLGCPLAPPRGPALEFSSWITQFRCQIDPDKCFLCPERRDKLFFPKFSKVIPKFSKV